MADEPKRPRWQIRRSAISDVTDVAGIGCVVWSAWSLNSTLGELVLGLSFLAVGWAVSR
jgi:hypothetical protein